MKKTTALFILGAVLWLLSGCAKQGMPSGGPRDITPPRVTAMSPENGRVHFAEGGFSISFDEYFVTKDVENNVLVSPPMKNKPEIKIKGKTLQVRFKDSLQNNTTYLFQFRNAIADYNEGNVLPSIEYVFSTGEVIDSMSVTGKVVDAFSLQSRKEPVSVFLFDTTESGERKAENGERKAENGERKAESGERRTESGERKTESAQDSTGNNAQPIPVYATRCDTGGHFSFNHIKSGLYRIVAAEDGNKNLTVDNGEAAGFVDIPVTTTRMNDSSASSQSILILLFDPRQEGQRVTGSDFKSKGKFVVTTLSPMEDPQISFSEQVVWNLNKTRDTLTGWTYRRDCDSLVVSIHDTTGIADTLLLRYRPKRGLASTTLSPTFMRFKNSTLPWFDTLQIVLSNPLDTMHSKLDSALTVMNLKDSSTIQCRVFVDSCLLRLYVICPFSQGETYSVNIHKGTLFDIYGVCNDPLTSKITVTEANQYGDLRLSIISPSNQDIPLIIQLLDEKNKVSLQRRCIGSSKLIFQHLKPGKYRVRVIMDENNNGEWDTGDFTLRQQPEKVQYLAKPVDVRANWEYEEKMIIDN